PKNCVKFFVQRAALNSKFALFLAKILHEILALLISSSFLSDAAKNNFLKKMYKNHNKNHKI
ncbi:MAG: hypothetical protein RI894_1486, partial [Bacteroidota bacterium]